MGRGCGGEEGEWWWWGSDRLKLGTFVAARHFSRQPADMTAKAGEKRVAGSQDPSRKEHGADRWLLHAQAIMMGPGEERVQDTDKEEWRNEGGRDVL